jgi:hypothetical protein
VATDVTLCPRAVGRQARAPESLEMRSRDEWAVVRAPLAALIAFLLLAAAANWLASAGGGSLCACPFKLVTGLACPGCGATRAALAFLSGHVGDAWRWNPLLTCAYLLAPPWLALRCLARKRAVIELTGPRAGQSSRFWPSWWRGTGPISSYRTASACYSRCREGDRAPPQKSLHYRKECPGCGTAALGCED